jgi:hypothetical protein
VNHRSLFVVLIVAVVLLGGVWALGRRVSLPISIENPPDSVQVENPPDSAQVENPPDSAQVENPPDSTQVGEWNLSTQVNDAAAVRVEVRPLALGEDVISWDFTVALNTHSVTLDDDLLQAAVLRCDREEEHRPIAWDGSPPGGHHRQGVLRFTPLDHESQYLELVIQGVAQEPERSFRWEALPVTAPSDT